MASLTKKITESQIRKLVSESKNSHNPLSMVFTYDYVTSLVPLNWDDMNYAIENHFIAHKAAIQHALLELQNNENVQEEVLELACMLNSEAEFPYDIYKLLANLVQPCMQSSASDSVEKFLYVSLNWVYEHKNDYCNPIEVIDILCNEISYPDEVKNLVSFMHTSESLDGTTFDKLILYLKNQRRRWK